jgi:nicotinate phosphoribosyltransferase
MTLDSEPAPVPGERLLCRHPFDPKKRVYVTPAAVREILTPLWDGPGVGVVDDTLVSLEVSRTLAQQELKTIREDILREINPTPYKVSVSCKLYQFFHNIWEEELPISEIA